MAMYVLGYELQAGGELAALDTAIEQLSAVHWRCLPATWLVQSDLRAPQIVEQLKSSLPESARLTVFKLNPDSAAWIGFNEQSSQWLIDHLRR